MKKIIKIFALIAILLVPFSCSEKYVTTVDLAVDYSDDLGGLVLKKNTADTCYIHVTSNTDWSAGLTFSEQTPAWCELTETQGSGIAWIPLIYQANESGAERTAIFNISISSKTLKFTITQPK